MKIIIPLIRNIFTTKSTLGELFIKGKYFCYTLEDVVRGDDIKIQDETAIPEGLYKLKISYSNRFKRDMIELINVPNFTGIRIHGGNTSKNTAGCPLVAYNKIDNNTIQGTAEKQVTEYVEKEINNKNEVYLLITNKTR